MKLSVRKDKLEFIVVLTNVFLCLFVGILIPLFNANIFNILFPFIIYSILILIFIKNKKLYSRAHIIIMIYFFIIGLIAGSLVHVVLLSFQVPFSFSLFNQLYRYYILLFVVVLTFLPSYKLLIEKKRFVAKLEDCTDKYAIIRAPHDIFTGMAPGLYVATFDKIPKKEYVLVEKTKDGLKIKGD